MKLRGKYLIFAPLMLVFLFSGFVEAAPLEGRLPVTPGATDYQAYYDPDLDITWAANADSGFLDWQQSKNSVSTLDIGGITDWRLPSVDANGDKNVVDCSGGGVSGCADNEMGYLFWERGINGDVPGPFSNVKSFSYWSGTEFDSANAWISDFFPGAGKPSTFDKLGSFFVWAVKNGDVAAPPSERFKKITWRTLDGNYFIGKSPGPDMFWGTVDDVSGASINPTGFSSFGRDTQGLSFTDFTSGTQITRYDENTTGYEIEQFDYEIVWNCSGCAGDPVVNAKGDFELRNPSVIGTNSGIRDAGNQIGSNSFDTSDLTDPPKYFATTSQTYTLYKGQSPADFAANFGANIVTHFQYLLDSNTLPSDWRALQVQVWNWYIYEGNDLGFAGNSSTNFYYTPDDVSVVSLSSVSIPALGSLLFCVLGGLLVALGLHWKPQEQV